MERQDAALDRLIAPGTTVRKLGEGMRWSEGPVWIADGQYLLFSDVPGNRIHKWSEAEGLTVWKEPSGGDGPAKPGFREPGTNGLKPGFAGQILAADHGSRAIAAIDLATKAKRMLVTSYQGKKFNSPNDIAVAADGTIWFTDPPYGLDGLNDSPLKEQKANGVYRATSDGKAVLVEPSLSFPNGLGFSPDGKTLYVTVSDPKRAVIMAYDVTPQQTLARARVFSDMTALVSPANPGLPDGMTVDEYGNVWSSGPGGIHIFSPAGKRLGLIRTGTAIANLAFGGPDGTTLFLTSNHMLVSLPTKVHAAPVHAPAIFETGERG
ncbi:SMP-30/gluconolactonase/LRE family protein [Sphingomonas piscis]|uniref:SMP-30/gluconolactonase/LRE family protein n=1 Tax=Sphingomonas piscis TaxID=2714943 RepID=A0A6G7YT70_9SPHN|nr:SMP-30/gluconolactonase/LRE family protein [Sphingomonas piscis]